MSQMIGNIFRVFSNMKSEGSVHDPLVEGRGRYMAFEFKHSQASKI